MNKQILNAAKRLVAKVLHKAKSSFSVRQLFHVCDRLIGRKRSSPLPSAYPLHNLPNVFNTIFLRKSYRFALIFTRSHRHLRFLDLLAFVDPSAMMTRMREDSDFWSLPRLTTLCWRRHLIITKHPEDGHGTAQMDNTTIRLITF